MKNETRRTSILTTKDTDKIQAAKDWLFDAEGIPSYVNSRNGRYSLSVLNDHLECARASYRLFKEEYDAMF